MKNIILMMLIILISGCSTTPINLDTVKHVPSHKIYENKYFIKHDNQATVIFTRDSGFTGSGCRFDVLINNETIFNMGQNERIELFLDPGSYFFKISTGRGACPNLSLSQNTILTVNDIQEYRISFAGQITFVRTK